MIVGVWNMVEGLFKCVYFADVDLLCITGYQCINNVLCDACGVFMGGVIVAYVLNMFIGVGKCVCDFPMPVVWSN